MQKEWEIVMQNSQKGFLLKKGHTYTRIILLTVQKLGKKLYEKCTLSHALQDTPQMRFNIPSFA